MGWRMDSFCRLLWHQIKHQINFHPEVPEAKSFESAIMPPQMLSKNQYRNRGYIMAIESMGSDSTK
jgi:hypothetical protein